MIVSQHNMDEIIGKTVPVVTIFNGKQLRWMWCLYEFGENKYAYRI
jgi:hypothetical protein